MVHKPVKGEEALPTSLVRIIIQKVVGMFFVFIFFFHSNVFFVRSKDLTCNAVEVK